MRNIIVYVHDLRSSGVVRNAIDHARRLSRDHPTTLVAGYDVGLFREQADDGELALRTLAGSPGPLARAAAACRLRRSLRTQPPSVLMSPGNMAIRHVTGRRAASATSAASIASATRSCAMAAPAAPSACAG